MLEQYFDPLSLELFGLQVIAEKKKAGEIKAVRMTAWRVAMLILYCCCLRRVDIYGVITDFYILLYGLVNTPLIAAPLLYQLQPKYGIPIRPLFGDSFAILDSLPDVLDLLIMYPIVMFGRHSRLSMQREILIQIDEHDEWMAPTQPSNKKDDPEVAGVAPLSLRIEEKVIVLLSAVSMPNLASQLSSPSASPLDLVLAAAAIALYVAAVLAAVYGYLLGAKRPGVWRYSVIVGSVCTVYAFLCSVALYLPEAYRWLVVLPCTALLPAFYLAIRDSDFGR